MDATKAPEADQLGSAATKDCDWDGLVGQYQPLINALCRRLGLNGDDAADVSQEVWLKVFTHLHTLRDRQALPGWIKTTTTHAAYSLLRSTRRVTLLADPAAMENSSGALPGMLDDDDIDAELLHDERVSAVRSGLAELPERSRELVGLLVADPPIRYDEISVLMDMPIGSIGPTRARCLSKLANTAPVRALMETAA